MSIRTSEYQMCIQFQKRIIRILNKELEASLSFCVQRFKYSVRNFSRWLFFNKFRWDRFDLLFLWEGSFSTYFWPSKLRWDDWRAGVADRTSWDSSYLWLHRILSSSNLRAPVPRRSIGIHLGDLQNSCNIKLVYCWC